MQTLNPEKTCCFTGHRPENCGNPQIFQHPQLLPILQDRLTQAIISKIQAGYTHFICGLARGTDLLCGEIVLALQNTYPQIQLCLAIPCENQTRNWPSRDIARYKHLVLSGEIVYLNRPYTQYCMQARNRFMIDHSSAVIAFYNGKKGGTQNTLLYAKQRGIDITILSPNEIVPAALR